MIEVVFFSARSPRTHNQSAINAELNAQYANWRDRHPNAQVVETQMRTAGAGENGDFQVTVSLTYETTAPPEYRE